MTGRCVCSAARRWSSIWRRRPGPEILKQAPSPVGGRATAGPGDPPAPPARASEQVGVAGARECQGSRQEQAGTGLPKQVRPRGWCQGCIAPAKFTVFHFLSLQAATVCLFSSRPWQEGASRRRRRRQECKRTHLPRKARLTTPRHPQTSHDGARKPWTPGLAGVSFVRAESAAP